MTISNYRYAVEVITPNGKEFKEEIVDALHKEFGEARGFVHIKTLDIHGYTFLFSCDTKKHGHEKVLEIVTKIMGKVTIKTEWTYLNYCPSRRILLQRLKNDIQEGTR